MFTGRYMKQVEDCVSYHSKVFVTQLAKSGPKFELQELCDWLSFDVISDLLYSQSCDMLQNSRLRWIPEAYKVMSRRSMICLVQPKFFQYYIDRIFLFNDCRSIISATTWIRAQSKRRITSFLPSRDFFSLFTAAKSKKEDQRYTEKDMWIESILLLAAGADTTSTTMGALFYYLLRNRKDLLKLTDEIRNSFNDEDDITRSSLNNCLYLDACVKETMRLVPAVPNLSPRLVKAGGLVVCGKAVAFTLSIKDFESGGFRAIRDRPSILYWQESGGDRIENDPCTNAIQLRPEILWQNYRRKAYRL
ncbi:unnamed protein product [Penicillium manginii]